jgi:hypothetical protein
VAQNGHLPKSSLRPIAGGGSLEPKAAAAWNAMAARIYKQTGHKIAPNGPDSSYRSYSRQVYWRNWWCARGLCGNAAIPGTSNHGLGLAVDTDDAALVNQYGAQFGWQKRWSDAAHEWWHFRYASGHYSGPDPGPNYKGAKPKWWKKSGKRLAAARARRRAKRQRRREAKHPKRRAALHREIQKLSAKIKRIIRRRKKAG